MGPETLADVKAGDGVILFYRNGYERHFVERVTATQIILSGDRRFRRKSDNKWNIGRCIGSTPYGSAYIDVGSTAADRVKEIDDNHARTVASNEWFRAARLGFSADGVRDVRAACDHAEAVLRELGEWTEPA